MSSGVKQKMRPHRALGWALFLLAFGAQSLVRVASRRAFSRARRSCLVVEAGTGGWREPAPGLIDLEQSARSYLGVPQVIRLEIVPDLPYIDQVRSLLQSERVTHYLYDTRSSGGGFALSLWYSWRIGLLFARYDVTPITILTNFALIPWQFMVSIVTASRGLVLTLLGPEALGSAVPHGRVFGPILMPISRERLDSLSPIRSTMPRINAELLSELIFVGSLYEPRRSALNEMARHLNDHGFHLTIVGRELHEPKVPSDRYFALMARGNPVLTTAEQLSEPLVERNAPPHLVYRYSEALLVGALLLAPEITGADRVLVPDVDFVAYENHDQLVQKLLLLRDNPALANRIAESGGAKMRNYVGGNQWWVEVDHALGHLGFPLRPASAGLSRGSQ